MVEAIEMKHKIVNYETYTIFYLGQFRAFYKEWHTILVRGLLRHLDLYIPCFSRGWSVFSLTLTPSFSYMSDIKSCLKPCTCLRNL